VTARFRSLEAGRVDSPSMHPMKRRFAEYSPNSRASTTLFSNSGGITGASKLLGTDVAAMRPAMDIRFLGSDIRGEVRSPKMREGSSIVLMSGIATQRPIPGAWLLLLRDLQWKVWRVRWQDRRSTPAA
jgi:hypothetical protein